MDLPTVKKMIAEIESVGTDYEVAHAKEDELYLKLLRAIAEGTCTDPEACAQEAIKTQFMDFPRYCA